MEAGGRRPGLLPLVVEASERAAGLAWGTGLSAQASKPGKTESVLAGTWEEAGAGPEPPGLGPRGRGGPGVGSPPSRLAARPSASKLRGGSGRRGAHVGKWATDPAPGRLEGLSLLLYCPPQGPARLLLTRSPGPGHPAAPAAPAARPFPGWWRSPPPPLLARRCFCGRDRCGLLQRSRPGRGGGGEGVWGAGGEGAERLGRERRSKRARERGISAQLECASQPARAAAGRSNLGSDGARKPRRRRRSAASSAPRASALRSRVWAGRSPRLQARSPIPNFELCLLVLARVRGSGSESTGVLGVSARVPVDLCKWMPGYGCARARAPGVHLRA